MDYQDLHDYIKRQREKGKPEEEIQKNLVDVGWKESDIETALSGKTLNKIFTLPEAEGVGGYYIGRCLNIFLAILVIRFAYSPSITSGFNKWFLITAGLCLLFGFSKNPQKYIKRDTAEELLDKAQGIQKISE